MPFLNRFSDPLYSLLRLMAGLLFACHGAQKLFGALGGPQMLHIPLMLAAGIIEFFGGLLIALGVLTAYAAFIACGEMAVAYSWATRPMASGQFAITASPPSCIALFFFTSLPVATVPGAPAACSKANRSTVRVPQTNRMDTGGLRLTVPRQGGR